jgi:endoglucanase
MENLLNCLLNKSGISGYEEKFSDYVNKILKDYCVWTEIDNSSNVIGMVNQFDPKKKTILLEAHLDRIGLMVTQILDNGFVRFRMVGGVDERILPASQVIIFGKEECFGVIGAVPPHLKGISEKEEKNPKISDMVIDTGLSKEDAEEKFSVGDPILLCSTPTKLLNNTLSSAALDNRAGMVAVFECLKQISDKELPVNVMVAFTVGEELALKGARTLNAKYKPDLAIVVDVTHGTTHDSKKSDTFSLGSGAIICKGPNLHYDITNNIISVAKSKNIPYEIEVCPGNTGTNAWAIQLLGKGIPCALISIPLRYMHTSVETVKLNDIENVGKLLSNVILGGGCFA